MNIFIYILIYIIALIFINFGTWIRFKSLDFSNKTIKIYMLIISIFLTVATFTRPR